MKRLIFILSFVLMFLGATGVLAQNPPAVFGWNVYTIPQFPTNDSISLSASTDVNAYPVIPGYNNQNSLQVDITYGGTGYAFIGYTFPVPFTMPQLCEFVVRSTDGSNFSVAPLIKYQGVWYLPFFTNPSSLGNGWYRVTDTDWKDITNSTPFPEDSITIQDCILYINGYDHDITLTLDTWYLPNWSGGDPILYCGFGDILSGLENLNNQMPSEYSLSQNYPNPFNPSTSIEFTIPNTEFVNLSIYNTLGQKVAKLVDEELTTGTYEFNFVGANLPSGIYFYTLTTKNYTTTKKMTLLK